MKAKVAENSSNVQREVLENSVEMVTNLGAHQTHALEEGNEDMIVYICLNMYE